MAGLEGHFFRWQLWWWPTTQRFQLFQKGFSINFKICSFSSVSSWIQHEYDRRELSKREVSNQLITWGTHKVGEGASNSGLLWTAFQMGRLSIINGKIYCTWLYIWATTIIFGKKLRQYSVTVFCRPSEVVFWNKLGIFWNKLSIGCLLAWVMYIEWS